MPDITKCSNDKCPLKERCYRFTCEPSMRQSYCNFTPAKDGKCSMFWEVYKSGDILTKNDKK